ncbi:MAG: signal peptidase I, partial [Candidatus Omnitrophica bacterium]|nr:signal peptidase I [Candidatus Omnitrophota bacterium]
IIASIIRVFIIQPFKIPSTSMYPTLKVGDRIFVNKFLYGAKVPFTDSRLPKVRTPERGDIIVFQSVTDAEFPDPAANYTRLVGPVFFDKEKKFFKWYSPRFLVKRLIGLPGDTVLIKEGDIYVNGNLLDQPRVLKNFTYLNGGDYGKEGVPITVPKDSYFALGDNSANSVDSRYWGYIPAGNLTGKVFVIWWPITRIRMIE